MKKAFTFLFSLLLLTAVSYQSNAQVMVGSPIDGTAADGMFGSRVTLSADASRIGVVASDEVFSSLSSMPGIIRFYDLDGGTSSYSYLDAQFPLGESLQIGEIVALSDNGNRMAAIGQGDFTNFFSDYDSGGNTWSVTTINLEPELDMDLSGDGNYVVIGHGEHTSVWDITTDWAQKGANIPHRGDHVAISADGNRVAISNSQTNVARTYEWDNSMWNMLSESIASDGLGGDIAISGDGSRVAIVSPSFFDIFVLNSDDLASNPIGGGSIQLGSGNLADISFTTDGSRLAVGLNGQNSPQSTTIYDYDGTSWTQYGTTIEFSGGEVDMTPDGNFVVIGNPAMNSNLGQVQVYDITPMPSSVISIEETNIDVFPNPTMGEVRFSNVQADQVEVFDNMGRLLKRVQQPGNRIDISGAPAGMYFLKITEGEKAYSARVVKEL